VDLWLLPSSTPFVTMSHYHGRNIYSKAVLADFQATYEKQLSGRVFEQWRYKRYDDTSGNVGLSADGNTCAVPHCKSTSSLIDSKRSGIARGELFQVPLIELKIRFTAAGRITGSHGQSRRALVPTDHGAHSRGPTRSRCSGCRPSLERAFCAVYKRTRQ
jgi:hypothetical protein